MNLYLGLLIILSLVGIKICIKGFNREYLSKETTSSIKGIFILIVFFSHLDSYIHFHNIHDYLMLSFRDFLGQLMVAMFLFYSGYGVYEQIKKYKKIYIKQIPKKRVLITWINYVVVVLSFLLIGLIIKETYSIRQVVFSIFAWESIGNSNWYIFGIIIMYICTYLAFCIFDKNDKYAIKMVWVLSLLFIAFMNKYKMSYWFDTILCFPLGITYSLYKMRIEQDLMKFNKKYLITLSIFIVAFLILKMYQSSFIFYELLSMVFTIVMILITMKVNICNKVLKWFGDNLFYVYILQRMPMIIFSKYSIWIDHPCWFSLICMIATILLTFLYKNVLKILDKKIINLKEC